MSDENPIPGEKLDEWQKATDDATPGPWIESWFDDGDDDKPHRCSEVAIDGPGDFGEVAQCRRVFGGTQDEQNGHFIVVARTAMPLLIAEVRRQRKALQRARAAMECHDAPHPTAEGCEHPFAKDVAVIQAALPEGERDA
jgi:hypothetical protein